jgi:Na+/H+ antiporter 1
MTLFASHARGSDTSRGGARADSAHGLGDECPRAPEDVSGDGNQRRRLPLSSAPRSRRSSGSTSPWGSTYDSLWSTELSIRLGDLGLDGDLRYWVNEGLMAFFFVVGLEVRREFDMGELRGAPPSPCWPRSAGCCFPSPSISCSPRALTRPRAGGWSCRPTRPSLSACSRSSAAGSRRGCGRSCSRSRSRTTSAFCS